MKTSHVIRDASEGRTWVHTQQAFWKKPGLILLSGPMGAGKTQLVRWILQELGSREGASPTFNIHHRYQTPQMWVDHFDLYRLQSDQELESTGFWDILSESDNLAIIEWADRLPPEAFPQARRRISIIIDQLVTGERVYHVSF